MFLLEHEEAVEAKSDAVAVGEPFFKSCDELFVVGEWGFSKSDSILIGLQ